MKRSLINSALVLSSLAVFFLALEASLAAFHPQKTKNRPYHEKYDPVIGWINAPFKDDDVQFEFAPNRYFHVTHNSKGLRGREAAYERTPGVSRVLFLGDSFFWGYGVENNEVFTGLLQERTGAGAEFLNGGTTGYGTDQMLLWLQREGLKYRPDVVVLGLCPANDLHEIATSVSYNYPKPVFMLEGNGLVLKNVPVPRTAQSDRKAFGNPPTLFGKVKKFLRYHTHTYNFIVRRLNSRPDWRLLLLNLGLAEEYTDRLEGVPFLRNEKKDLEKLEFRLVLEIRKTAEQAGATFVLLNYPAKERDSSGTIDYEGKDIDWAFGANAYFSGKAREFARKERVKMLDLLPLVRERHARGEALYHRDGYDHHWTPEGHWFVAETVYEYLKNEKMVPLP